MNESPEAKNALFVEQAMPYLDQLYGHAMRKTGNPADANDLVQETYMKAFAAFASYERYVTFNQEFVDALLSYLQMLRTQRGGEEALRSIGKLRKVAPGNPAIEFVELRLASGDVRRSRLEAFVARHPDFAPAILDLADFYSAEEMPDRSGVDVDKEQEWLQRFVDVAEQGGFRRYYVDKTQAEKLLAAARQRLVKTGGDVAMEADEKVFLANSNEVWVMDNNATKIEFSFDGKDWRPIAGLVTTIMLARGTIDDPRVLDRAATVYVRYTDKRGAVSQVYRLPVASVDTKSAAPELGQPLEAPSGLP